MCFISVLNVFIYLYKKKEKKKKQQHQEQQKIDWFPSKLYFYTKS